MSDRDHEKALALTEEALGKLSEGDDAAADTLLSEAEKLDPEAPAEVLAEIDEDLIRQRAHEIWDKAGRPDGAHAEHWEQAKREIQGRADA